MDYEHSPSHECAFLTSVEFLEHAIHLPSPAFPSPNFDPKGSNINTARVKNGRSHASKDDEGLVKESLPVLVSTLDRSPRIEGSAKGSQSLEFFPSVDPQSILERKKKSNLKNPSKCIQEKCGQVKMVVGEDLAISDITNFNGKLFVVRFSTHKSLSIQAFQNWMA